MQDRMKNIFFLLMMILSTTHGIECRAQERATRLYIGDNVPVLPELPIVNYIKPVYNLNASKNKVLIVDFFDTNCASCIENMPRLDKIARSMGGRVEIVLVTWQSHEVITKFFAHNRYLKEHNCVLPTIVSDTLLRKYFPHNAISHVAWLYQGKVQAITYPDYVTSPNLEKLLRDGQINLPIKDDFRLKEVVDVADLANETSIPLYGKVLMTGYDPDLAPSSFKVITDSLTGEYLAHFNNMDVLGALTAAWSYIKKPTYILTGHRIEWKVDDKNRYMYDDKQETSYKMWQEENAISYRRQHMRPLPIAEAAKLLLNDVGEFMGVVSSWEMRRKKCLVIKACEKTLGTKAENARLVRGTGVLAFQLDYSGKYLPVIDDVESPIEMEIPQFSNIEELNRYLTPYGVHIVEEERDIEVFVVQDIKE